MPHITNKRRPKEIRESVKKIVRKFVSALRKSGISVERAILFGSHAKGNADSESDIDLCIVSEDLGKDLSQDLKTLGRIARRINPRIEFFPCAVEKYRNNRISPILHEIRTSGVKIA